MNPLLMSAAVELYKMTMSTGPSIKTKDGKDGKTDDEIAIDFVKKFDDNRPFWERKTFWATVVAVAVPILNKAIGLNMEIEEVSAAIAPLIAFILGESWRKKGS